MELMEKTYVDFEKKRDTMVTNITDLTKRCILLKERKLDESSAIDSFQEVKDAIQSNLVLTEKNIDNITTLENYVERYLPLSTIKVL